MKITPEKADRSYATCTVTLCNNNRECSGR